jgi:hypothetical protein
MQGKLKISLLALAAGLLLLGGLGQSTLKVLVLDAVEDTYVVTDLADAADPQGFRKQNYGSLEFLKTWYAWGVLQDERLLSVDLIKFDLTKLKGLDIESASVQLFARQTNLTQPARLVDVHVVNGKWSEQEVTYETRPQWDNAPVATSAIYGAGGWYSWNITGFAASAVGRGELSIAVALRSATQKNEEQVLFVAKEALDKTPRLLVTYNTRPSSGIGSVDWWWWAIIAGGAVALVGGAFSMGIRRRRAGSTGPG